MEALNDNIGNFILFEGIGKNISFNSILDLAILSDVRSAMQ